MILDVTGNVVVEYKYDAWGDHNIILSEPTYENLAKANPFRYRGYCYDDETGLYYLKSRYYDPETGRFINADNVSFIQSKILNGVNIYLYCLNNPIFYVDNNGCFPVPIWSIIVGFAKDIFAGVGAGLLKASDNIFAQLVNMPMYLLDDAGGAVFNPTYLRGMTKATNLQYKGKILSSLGKVAKGVSYALLVVDIGLSIYNNFTNPNLSTSRKITDSIVDVGFSIGGFFASMAIGAAFGGPIGVVLGLAVSVGIYLFQLTSFYQDLKVAFNTFITQTIPNAWNKFVDGWNYFWSFSWI